MIREIRVSDMRMAVHNARSGRGLLGRIPGYKTSVGMTLNP